MKTMMQFTSIHTALQWFFNHDWIRAPRDVCSIKLLKVDGGSPRMDDVEKIYNTFVAIDRVLNELNPKQFFILRNGILPKLETRLIKEKVLSEPHYEEPLYAEG